MKRIYIILILAFMAFKMNATNKDVDQLVHWMVGSYSSEEQHLKDTANYFHIKLNMTQIWKENKNGYWLYIEQAVADYYDKPYRQRVYHVYEKEPGTFVSAVYTFADPLRFTHQPELLEKTLTPDSITQKEGCEVILKKIDKKTFSGGTEGKQCPSERKGASYASAIVTVTANELHSWDRGYDAAGKQVWGAEISGYIFKKLSAKP